MKRTRWRGNAMEAEIIVDPLELDEQVVTLTVHLAPGETPRREVGREVDVVLTRPMLELLAEMAADIGAIYHVQVEPPSWGRSDDDSEAYPHHSDLSPASSEPVSSVPRGTVKP